MQFCFVPSKENFYGELENFLSLGKFSSPSKICHSPVGYYTRFRVCSQKQISLTDPLGHVGRKVIKK